ncbi:unnamed protein product, partial [Sphagnum troendelagicum]
NKSKIIVTCRNWQILENHVNEVGKVDIKPLEESQAKKLFMFHAYGVEEKMKPNFNDITDEIVKACAGLPLSIEVMGRFLKTKHCLRIWKEAFQLTTLETLNLSKCSQLKELPTSIGQLTTLETLNLSKYSELKELPTSIGQLNTLQKLVLSGCSQLKELPSSIGQLTTLQKLVLFGCSQLKELPSSIGQLITLQTLDLSRHATLLPAKQTSEQKS